MPTNEKRTSLMKTLLIPTGLILILATGILLLIKKILSGDPPIEVGDGSITFQYDKGIKKKSDYAIEADQLVHKVKSLSIGDYGGTPNYVLDLKGRAFNITSNSTPYFQITLNSYLIGLEDGVLATCPSTWSLSGSIYTCNPTGASKLTPITITFTDGGNCSVSSTPICTLSCPSGRCDVKIEYK